MNDAHEQLPKVQVEPTPKQSFWRQIGEALFLDLPYMVDSRWRHCEYALSRNHDYRIQQATDGAAETATMTSRPRYRNAAFAFLLLTLVFIAYGPTFAAICGVGSPWLARILYAVLSLGSATLGYLAFVHAPNGIFRRSNQRLHDVNAGRARTYTLRFIAFAILGIALLISALLTIRGFLAASDPDLCRDAEFSWRALAQAGCIVLACAAAFRLACSRLPSLVYARRQSILILAMWAVGWWILATPDAREADGLPYRHGFALFAALLFAVPLLAAPLARRLFRSVSPEACADFALALRHTELLVERVEPQLSGRRWVNAVVNGPLYHPLHLFFLPSLVAIMASDEWLWTLCIAAFLFAALLLTWGYISVRWQQMVLYIDRWFFSGTPLVVSLGVILIAGARLAGSSYVTTLLGAAAFGVIFMWVLMTYAALWLFEQVVNQSLGPQLLRILDNRNDKKDREPDFIDYPAGEITAPLANPDRRYIALHGAGRLAVVATHKGGRLFHTYRGGEVFSVLAANADVIEQRCPQFKNLNARMTESAHDVERRIRLYFNLLNLSVLVLLGSLLLYAKHSDSHAQMMPVVTAQQTPQDTAGRFDLAQALQKQSERQRPAYIVAASGGGTRAAVYTASALRGMAQAGLSDDIVLMSGVSGGGVALAYYAMHKPTLGIGASFDVKAWERYRDGMAEPFIQDVLEGSMEWRIAGSTPLSALLVESFHRRLTTGERTRFAEIGDVGLILNTSITGHPASDSVLVGNAMDADSQHIDEHDCLPFAMLSGQRLSFSNISDTHRFPQPAHSRLPDIGFAFVVVNDPAVELVQAAALNANFPPVFPNARVDLLTNQAGCGGRRTYHVTDGGATENLGLISALYALQSTLDTLITQKAQDPGKAITLPELHVVALEASAIGVDYAQDRGIGTATGGSKERLAGGLTEQLIAGIELQATMLNGRATPLHLHYVALPTAFRSRGGVGTHWMLPNYVTITNPHLPHAPEWWTELPPVARNNVHARLGKQALFALLEELHDPAVDFCSRERTDDSKKIVASWICGADPGHPTAPDLHVTEWRRLIQGL